MESALGVRLVTPPRGLPLVVAPSTEKLLDSARHCASRGIDRCHLGDDVHHLCGSTELKIHVQGSCFGHLDGDVLDDLRLKTARLDCGREYAWRQSGESINPDGRSYRSVLNSRVLFMESHSRVGYDGSGRIKNCPFEAA